MGMPILYYVYMVKSKAGHDEEVVMATRAEQLIRGEVNNMELQDLIDRLNLIFIDLENLLGTTPETDDLEVAIQALEKLLP